MKGRELSFTEIAKIVGERWQVLSQNEKEVFERQATTAKEKYYAELNEYKKTPQYAQYQEYLVNFKAKHAAANGTWLRCSCTVKEANLLRQRGNVPSWRPKQMSILQRRPAVAAGRMSKRRLTSGPAARSWKDIRSFNADRNPAHLRRAHTLSPLALCLRQSQYHRGTIPSRV